VIERRRDVRRDSVKLAVRDFGGDGRDLLLVHGLASTSHIFDLLAPELTSGFHVVAYDQRGHGESSKPSSGYGFDQTAADGAAVIRELGLDRPVVVGHSWGANVALELAVRAPGLTSGLILLDGGFLAMRDRMDWKSTKEMLAPPPIAGMHIDEYLAMIRRFMEGRLELSPGVEAVFRSLMRVDGRGRIRPRLSRSNHLRVLRAMWEEDPPALLRRVRVPTLVVATRQEDPEEADAMFIAAKQVGEEVVREIDGGVRFQWIEGIHDVPLQRPDAVAELVRGFVAGLPA
jgi:pimeloyl-ACP methyl ester carboxylesterase